MIQFAGFATITMTMILSLSGTAYAFPGGGGRNSCNYSEHHQGLEAVEAELLKQDRVADAATELVNFADSVQYLIIGENHLDSTPKLLLQRSLKLLKAKGFTHFGLEMLNQSAQRFATSYCQGDLSKEQFTEVWRRNWAYGAQRDNYLNMVEEACSLGFQLIALDVRNEQNLNVPEYDRMDERNSEMARALIEATGEAKAIVLTGSLHSGVRQMLRTQSKHFQQMTRTSILSEIYWQKGAVEIESVAIGSRMTLIDDPRVCPGQSVMGYFKELGPSAPAGRVMHRNQYQVFDRVILQAEPPKVTETAPVQEYFEILPIYGSVEI